MARLRRKSQSELTEQMNNITARLNAACAGQTPIRKFTSSSADLANGPVGQFAVWLDNIGILTIITDSDNIDVIEEVIGYEAVGMIEGTYDVDDVQMRLDLRGFASQLTSSGWSPQKLRKEQDDKFNEIKRQIQMSAKAIKAPRKNTLPPCLAELKKPRKKRKA